MINKKLFYNEYRNQFGSIKNKKTVENIDTILDRFDKTDIKIKEVEKKAYMLATVRHECGADMLPITENMRYSAGRLMQVWPNRFRTNREARKYAYKPRELANKVYGGRLGNGLLDGYRFRGRGYVQITGHTNYLKFSKLLGVDLLTDPDLAKKPEIAAEILVRGMIDGLFTGRKLSGYITSGGVDYYNARSIVNADKRRVGASIARNAEKFAIILLSSIDK